MPQGLNPIAVVERETGIGKDTLRVWERRYGFPTPQRGPRGDRLYPEDQISQLRLLKRLIDGGHRPGKLMKMDPAVLQDMLVSTNAIASESADSGRLESPGTLIDKLRAHDVGALHGYISHLVTKLGLQNFVMKTLPVLNNLVGEAWSRGDIEIFEEHLYTEQMQAQLRQSISALPTGHNGPRILLTSLPREQHGIGLLMLEAVFRMEGAQCVSLGTETPLTDIAAASKAHRIDVVALTFSAAFPQRQIPALLAHLRRRLPGTVDIWAGGSGMRHVSAPEGVLVADSLESAECFLSDWRKARG